MQMIKSLSSGPEKKMSRNQIDEGMSAWKNEEPQAVILNAIGHHGSSIDLGKTLNLNSLANSFFHKYILVLLRQSRERNLFDCITYQPRYMNYQIGKFVNY